MKRQYSFEIHKYAPELNKAFINGCRVPGYVPTNLPYAYEEQIRELRYWLQPMFDIHTEIIIEHTGATKGLPNQRYLVNALMPQRLRFLTYIREKHSGIAEFATYDEETGKMKFEEKEFGYRIISARRVFGW